MSDVVLTIDDAICLMAEYIIERGDQNFMLKMGHFHGQPMIIEQSDSMAQLRRYIAVDCDIALSDEEFCSALSEFLMSIYQRQNDYRRNISFGTDGSLSIGRNDDFKAVRRTPSLPALDL